MNSMEMKRSPCSSPKSWMVQTLRCRTLRASLISDLNRSAMRLREVGTQDFDRYCLVFAGCHELQNPVGWHTGERDEYFVDPACTHDPPDVTWVAEYLYTCD